MRRIAPFAVSIVVVVVLLASAGPAAASRAQCARQLHRGSHVVAEGLRALVYERGGIVRACPYSNGRTLKLAGQGLERMNGKLGDQRITVDGIVLAGPFVAYESVWTERNAEPSHNGPDFIDHVYVVDLRSRTVRRRSEPGDRDAVVSLVLTGNGSVAWGGEHEVVEGGSFIRKMDHTTGAGEQIVDGGGPLVPRQVDPSSLALATDRHTLYWKFTDRGTSGTGTADLR